MTVQRVLQDHPLLRAPGAVTLVGFPVLPAELPSQPPPHAYGRRPYRPKPSTRINVPATLWDILDVPIYQEDDKGRAYTMAYTEHGVPLLGVVDRVMQEYRLELVVQVEAGEGLLIRMRALTPFRDLGRERTHGWYPACLDNGHELPNDGRSGSTWGHCRLEWMRKADHAWALAEAQRIRDAWGKLYDAGQLAPNGKLSYCRPRRGG